MMMNHLKEHLTLVDHIANKATKPNAIQAINMSRELFYLALVEESNGEDSERIVAKAKELCQKAVCLTYR